MKQKLIFLVLGIFFAPPALAQQTLVLTTAYTAPLTSPDHTGALDLFYQELGKRTGIKFEIQSLPAERSLINANTGIDDGLVARVKGINQTYVDLRPVPEPVMQMELVAFSRNNNFTVKNAESFKPYSVGIVTGWKILEKTIVDTKSLDKVENVEQLFSLLDKNRIDVAVYEKLMGLQTILKMKMQDIKVLKPSYIEGEWYLYLNKKHEALIPEITKAIKEIKDDGTHKRIFDSVLKRYAH